MLNNVHKDEHRAKLDQHVMVKQLYESLVGPGSYNLSQKSDKKEKTFQFFGSSSQRPMKFDQSEIDKNPNLGPGCYTIRDLKKGSGFKQTSSKETQIKQSPGPGDYLTSSPNFKNKVWETTVQAFGQT